MVKENFLQYSSADHIKNSGYKSFTKSWITSLSKILYDMVINNLGNIWYWCIMMYDDVYDDDVYDVLLYNYSMILIK